MAPSCRHCGQLHVPYLTVCPITGARLGSATYTMVNADEGLVGNVVADRYHVRDILGQGSTGTAFGVVHAHIERGAAMKVLRPRYTTLETAHRVFQSDIRAAFAVTHPSLVEVFDVGTLPDGAPFFVTELLAGDTLAARLGRERFSTAAAVDLMMQLLSAMEAVHARDLLFRDLRPANIFLTQRRGCRPVVKILDLGLARLIPLEKVETEWNALRSVVGANDMSGPLSIPYYLSPERTRGEHGIEPASDIFIANIVFYEALTAQRPFTGSSWEALTTQIANAQPTPLSVLRPDVPEELAALVMRGLSGKPRSRPSTAREMQDELRAVFESPRRGSSSSMRSMPISAASAAVLPPVRPPPPAPVEIMPPSRRPTDKPAPMEASFIDEASADHPVRTVRPPPAPATATAEIDVDVEMDTSEPATSRGSDLASLLGSLSKRRDREEEETETMQLTPELRARIEQMTQSAVEDSTRPPPTRRAGKPPRG